MVEIFLVPQYNSKVENVLSETSVDNGNDDDDDFNFHSNAGAKRQVTDPPPSTNTMKCVIDDKKPEIIVYANGADDVPKVSELYEPELEPDLREPLAYAAMIRQVTEDSWSTWKTRQWEPDMELDIASRQTSTSSRSWADMTDDDAECMPREKVATVLTGPLGMTTETGLAPSVNFDEMTVHAIAASALLGGTSGQQQNVPEKLETASALLGGTSDQQQNVPEKLETKLKPGRRRKRESLIDSAARHLQRDGKQKNHQTNQNPVVHHMATKQFVPKYCTQCGGHHSQQYNFCMFCGAANS